MYGKVFESMYEGSLAGKWEAIVTFQQMLVLCNKDGILDVTPAAIHGKTSIPLEIIMAGIAVLEAPDLDSRTPDEEGRRIVRLDDHRPWGWRIVNKEKYDKLKTAEEKREYHRQYWHKRKKGAPDSTDTQPDSTPVDVDVSVASKNSSSSSEFSTKVVDSGGNFSDCAKLIIALNQGLAVRFGEDFTPVAPTHPSSMEAGEEILKTVPVDFALECVRDIASKYKPSGRSKQITTLGYCLNPVLDRWEKHRAMQDSRGPALGLARTKDRPVRAAAPPVPFRSKDPERVSPADFQAGIDAMKSAVK